MKRILVVDDREDNLALLQALLAGSGYVVELARHGAEALVKARQIPPDLVVSDLLMPVMDGYTLLRQWKADERLRLIPFVVYTATYTDPNDEKLALDLGADAFILKPAEPVEFMQRLEEVLRSGKASGAGPRLADEKTILKEYSQSLVHKLEEKLTQLEAANRVLTGEVATRKQLEQTLIDDERRLRDLINGLGPDVFVGLLTPGGEILEANTSALAAAGLRPEDTVGKPVEETYWFSYSADIQRTLRDAVNRAARGEGSRFDVEVRLAAGEFGMLDFSIQPLRDAAGRVRFLVPSAVVITARKRAEQRLQESERRFREIFESANVGIAVAGPDDRFLAVNAWFSEMLGYARDELLGRHTFDLVHPDDVAESRRLTEAVHEGRANSHGGERRYLKKDGTVIWVSVFSTTVVDERGREKYSVGVISDITDRRHAEAALRSSEQRFSKAFRSGPLAMSISLLADGRFVDVNDAFLAMFGFRREEVIGRTSLELGMWFNPADREALATELHDRGGFRDRELPFPRRDGSTGWALCAAEKIPLGDEDAVISLFTDITERRRAEHALREREIQLRLFVAHSPAAIAMLDRDLRYLVVSHRFLSDYALGDRNIVGLGHYEVFPDLPERWRDVHRRCLAGAVERCDEDPFIRADGTTEWVRWEVRPWHTLSGDIGGIILLNEVITNRKRAELALRSSEERLRLALDAAQMGIFDWDVVSDAVTWSPRHEALFGFASGEFDGTLADFERHIHPDDLPSVRADLAACRAEHRHFEREFRVCWPDGSEHWIQSRGEYTYGADGHPVHMHGVVLDFTERRQAENSLRMFRSLIDRSNDAIEVIDPDTGRFLDVNESACTSLGQTREEMLNLRVFDIDPRVSPERWPHLIQRIKEGGSRTIESMHRRRDGTTFPVEISTNFLNLGRDYLVAVVRDISERRRAEEVLAESRRRLSTLVANLPGAVYRSRNDPDWTTELVSEGIAGITGHTAEEFQQGRKHFGQLIHAGDRERVWQDIQQALAQHRPHEVVYRIHTAEGAEKWIWEQGRGIFGPDGKLQALEGYLADITAQKVAEVRVRRLNRLYSVLSEINTLIVRERDRQKLYDEVCRIAVELGGFALAWVGVVEPGTDAIKPMAIAGQEGDRKLIAGIKFTARADRRGGRGTVGEAVRTGRLAYNNDLAATKGADRHLAEFCRRGYRAAISLPLLTGDRCIGLVALYATEAGFFDQEELALLSELAEDVSFTLAYVEKEEKVHYLAYHDPVTGLGNRARLQEQLTAALAQARRENHACALLLMNINNFKDVNSTLGHHHGDQLLKQVAARIQGALWASDTVACLGGDEFAILLPRLASSADIALVIGKISDGMHASFAVADLPVTLEARVGYAIYPDHADSAEILWQRAGIALQGAREKGRAHLAYEPGIDHFDPRRLTLLSHMRRAIDADELVLYFQPKVDLQQRRTTGVEVLLRWQHPERGLVYPDEFIPLVERTGLINPMTTWVLSNAMRQARVWERAGFPLDVAVNLSVRNLQNPGLTTDILDLARSSRFRLQHLTLEVTESAIMVDPDHGRSVLAELHAAGVTISLDDFGIGQSSLAYLKDLPITQLKIDKSFIMGFAEARNAAIVRAALEMGHSLGMQVTAEGVEDEQTFLALADMGCDMGQGYFFGKPMPADALAGWLRSSRWKLKRK